MMRGRARQADRLAAAAPARGTAAVPIADAHWWHVSLFETAVVTDSSQESVRVRRFDRDRCSRWPAAARTCCGGCPARGSGSGTSGGPLCRS